jgi:hypothetical protein
MSNAVVRLTVNLSPTAADKLASLASDWGVNRTEALHRAIFTTALLQEKVHAGAKLLFSTGPGDKLQEVELSTMSRAAV